MILMEAHNIKHSVGERMLFAAKHLQVHRNDRIGLVGRNGSGKTTLLNILGGNVAPDEGTVKLHARCELLPQLKRTDTTKSGGEVTQAYINEALLKTPEVLLADEPTTNLDTEHIQWLEKKLKQWKGALIIVSHDRAFLDALCTSIWEISEGNIREYKGNYSDYVREKDLELRQRKAEYEQYDKKRSQLEEALLLKQRKAEKATKAPRNVSSKEARKTKPYFAQKQKKLQKNAKAIEVRIDKLEKVEKVHEIPPLKMDLPNATTFKTQTIIRVEEVNGIIGSRMLWDCGTFYVRGGDKVAIIGSNGCGKTTLIKKIIDQEKGITIAPSVRIGYFSQNLNIVDVNNTVLENVSITSKQSEALIRTVLARLHFYNDDVYKKVEVLSGGERVKVALAKIFLSDVNTLVLDEPTNYLDIDAATALESLLKEYEGTVIIVSHDRRLIENVATRMVIIRDKKIQLFDGAYGEWKKIQPTETIDKGEEKRLILDMKITEVLSRLSIEPSEELEKEFQQLLAEKRKLQNL